MGSFGYPVFAVCVVVYNVAVALGTVLCGWLSPMLATEEVSAADIIPPAHYTLHVTNYGDVDLLRLFPEARLQDTLYEKNLDQFQIIDLSMRSVELQTSSKEDEISQKSWICL